MEEPGLNQNVIEGREVKLTLKNPSGDYLLACPICNGEYIHPYNVASWKSDEDRNEESFSIDFECEYCRYKYKYVFDFHEGFTIVSIEDIEELPDLP